MKKRLVYTMLLALSLLSIISCSDDNNDVAKTNVKGKPSTLSFYNKLDGDNKSNFSYIYGGDEIKRIVGNGATYSDFSYKDGVLSAINSGQFDLNIMDGHSYIKFEKEENKITIETWAEPSSRVYKSEITLGSNDVPTKLVDLGLFVRDSVGQFVNVADGHYFSDFVYDSSTKKLMKQLVYKKSDSTLVYQINYDYDINPGLFSKVDLPIWYIAYEAFLYKDNIMLSSNIYLSNINNLISKEIIDKKINNSLKVNYTFKYDTDNYPISASSNSADEGDYMTIEY